MKNKKLSSALGLCLMLSSAASLAALNETEKGYVNQLAKGGYVTITSTAKSMYDTATANTEVLDVAAEVLLEKYPRAGEDHDAVEALAWVCRALGRSGNSRYRPVVEKVENDDAVHRKLRGHCEKAAGSLPKEVTNGYVAGTVNLAKLRDPSAAAATTAAVAAPAAAASASAPSTTAASMTVPKNPPPANKLQGYAGYELKAVTLSDEAAGKKNVDKVVARIDEGLKQTVNPILTEWNAAAGSAASKQKVVIEPHVVGVHKPSGANRFWAGAFAGNGYVIMKVKISEQPSGRIIAEPEFYRRANAMAGAWTFGAHDNAMLQKIGGLLANYLTENYTEAVGGITGFEP